MVEVINLLSVNTHSKRAELVKKNETFYIKTEKKILFIHSFTWKAELFKMWNCCQSRNVISGTFLNYKGLPCLDYVSFSAHKINNFIRVSCLKLSSSARCFYILPSGSVRETKLSWTPEISLFTWGEELAFYTLPLCEQGKAPLLHNHKMDQLTGNSSHFQQSTCTIFCPYNEQHWLFLTSLLKSVQRLLGELHKFILDYIWLYRLFCPFRCLKWRCPKLVRWRDDW